jgi:TolB-like protein/Flp pilus assembly protein TadD
LLSPGTNLARYRLVSKIGRGGMGEVWKAHDAHLDREVAVKVLAPGALDDGPARERFRREAHVLSRLSHPGVATIFDFDTQGGTDFLVMEYVPGGTLESRIAGGPLPVADVLKLGIAIGEALADAHGRGFLHRDLKSANVVLTAAGQPKILDFGIAGLLHAPTALTQAGAVMGSLPSMAPEQLLGEADDVRTDVYAFGVLLFEMAAARRPFVHERNEALMFEILRNTPPRLRTLRPDVPGALDLLVAACLAKEPKQRPESAAAVVAELRRIEAGAKGDTGKPEARESLRSIAVLPLENLSKDPAQEYFADGMTEALIGDLARIKALRVISRTSAMKYKGSFKSLPEIARELDVDAILEGSALLLGNRVRIRVQLVSARGDETLWADRYDRDLEDVLTLQSDVAETVAREIALQLTPKETAQLAQRPAVNAQAHVEYLKGRHLLADASPQAIGLALKHLEHALEVDPGFAPAWAALADLHLVRAGRGMAPPAEADAEAAAAANKALALDPNLAEAHAALAQLLVHRRDLAGAIRLFEKAIELNPGLPAAHFWLGRAYYCSERHPEAQAAMLRAVSLDPRSMIIHTAVGDAYYYAREFEKSVVYYRMAIELDPRFDGAHTDLARSLEALGQFDEAFAQYEEGRKLAGGVAGPSFGLAHLAASRGDVAEARRMLEALTAARATKVVSAWGIAALHASLGDVDDAFRWLDVAVEEGATGLIFLRVHPRIDALRKDPRFPGLLRRVGLA